MTVSGYDEQAKQIQNLATGIDTRPVTTEKIAKSISSETTFHADLGTFSDLEAELEVLCLKVSARLKNATIAGGRITLKLKRPDHQILTRSQTLQSRTDKAHLLFTATRKLLLAEVKPGRSFRLIGFGVDQLGAPDAPSLLDIEGGFSDRQNKLEAAMDQVQQAIRRPRATAARSRQGDCCETAAAAWSLSIPARSHVPHAA